MESNLGDCSIDLFGRPVGKCLELGKHPRAQGVDRDQLNAHGDDVHHQARYGHLQHVDL